MTARELIAELQKMPPEAMDAPVLIFGEGDNIDISGVEYEPADKHGHGFVRLNQPRPA